MGEAKRRGTFEQREAQAIERAGMRALRSRYMTTMRTRKIEQALTLAMAAVLDTGGATKLLERRADAD